MSDSMSINRRRPLTAFLSGPFIGASTFVVLWAVAVGRPHKSPRRLLASPLLTQPGAGSTLGEEGVEKLNDRSLSSSVRSSTSWNCRGCSRSSSGIRSVPWRPPPWSPPSGRGSRRPRRRPAAGARRSRASRRRARSGRCGWRRAILPSSVWERSRCLRSWRKSLGEAVLALRSSLSAANRGDRAAPDPDD